MKVKHFSQILIFVAGIGAVSTIAATNGKFQIFASTKYGDTQAKQPHFSRQNVETEIRQLTQQWIVGWSPDTEPFDPDKLKPLYAQGENAILVYDDVGEEVEVTRSLDEYAQTWLPFMKQFAYWSIQAEGDIEIRASEDMAVSNFVWIAKAKYQDGREISPKQYATLVWQKQDDGRWVIIHQHLTGAANN